MKDYDTHDCCLIAFDNMKRADGLYFPLHIILHCIYCDYFTHL